MTASTGTRSLQRNVPLMKAFNALLGFRIYVPLWLIYFHSLGISNGKVGLLWGVCFAADLTFDVLTGLLADRWGYGKTLILGSCLLALSFLGMYAAPYAPSPWWWLVANFAVMGVSSNMVYTSTPQALGSKSADLVEQDKVSSSITAYMLTSNAGATLLTLVLVEQWAGGAPRQVWLPQAVLTMGMVFIGFMTVEPERAPEQEPKHLLGWRVVIALIPLALVTTVANLTAFVTQAYCTSAGQRLSSSSITFALGYLGAAAAMFCFSKISRRLGTAKFTIVSVVALAASWFGAALLPGRGQLIAIVAMTWVCEFPGVIAVNFIVKRVANYKATALSTFSSCVRGLGIATYPAIGWAFDRWSLRVGCLLVACLLIVCLGIISIFQRRRFLWNLRTCNSRYHLTIAGVSAIY
jgi:MFS family permease